MSWLSTCIKGLLASRGLKLYRFDRHQVIPANVPDPQTYVFPEYCFRYYRPWLAREYDPWFGPQVLLRTMLTRQKLYFLRKCLQQTLRVAGDVFEAGVGSGGSSRLMLECLLRSNSSKRMWLLDTFEGYRKVDAAKDGAHVKLDQCRCDTREQVAGLLANDRLEVNLIQGLIPATLEQVRAEALCFAHIDVNLYEPTLAATRFGLSRLSPGGIMVFDDYGWPATYGARQAIDEACAGSGFEVICLPDSTQAFLVKNA
jgi:O-methyltransferase